MGLILYANEGAVYNILGGVLCDPRSESDMIVRNMEGGGLCLYSDHLLFSTLVLLLCNPRFSPLSYTYHSEKQINKYQIWAICSQSGKSDMTYCVIVPSIYWLLCHLEWNNGA